MHEALLSSQRGWEEYAGAYRTNLVWVGTDSYSPRGAAHVGPQSELIADAKTDLLEFIKHDDLPVVAQCAITYAQFETIYPFADGNGRCGRALVHVILSGLYSSETQSNGLDEKTIKDATCALAQGRRYDYEGIRLNPDEHFHILALSPNKSRLAIRFYLTDTFGVFAHNIEQYYQDTEIRRPRYDKTGFLPILRLLGQTIRKQRKDENAPVKKQKKKSAIENVSSEMVSAIMQAILNGTPYPVTLINVVERRINVERDVPPDKAAIIKAYYLRKTTNEQFKEVLQMDINEESEYLPYVLGRIFSIYEQIQLGAIPNINTTIKDKYFTSASTTPARIFPILGDLAAKHMRKAWKSEGLKIKLDKVLGTLTQKVGDHYPSRLSLEERGAFQLGYYFENQKRFNKTNKSNEDNEQGENND